MPWRIVRRVGPRGMVTNLRRQVEEGTGDPADRIGAAFREWRGERVERLVGDQATQAFSAGVAAASADGKVRWVVTTASGCSDCEDNALGRCGERFRSVPHGARAPPGPFGLPLPDYPSDRLTRTSVRENCPCLALGGGAADVRLPPCASPAI